MKDDDSKKKFSDTFLRRIFIGLFILLALAIIGISIRVVNSIRLRHTTEEEAVINVAIIKAAQVPHSQEIVLPGNVQAWHETTIYARTNGYVVSWVTDIGAHVKQGDLLAEITTPENVAQLRQTEANLKTAEANYQLAQTTAIRWKSLLKTDSVSKQETDEKVSDAKAQAATVVSTRASRDRLRDLVSFQKVVAPFDGVIMSRTTDIGRLINAGSGAVPLFRLVQADRLRAYVRVPQNYSANITPTLVAELHFPEHPEKVYPAKLLDTAQAVDQTTRTLLVQFEVDNTSSELLAGTYAEVHLKLPASKAYVILPANTLIFRSHGMQVATISKDGKAVLKKITIGRDFGNTVEVIAGLLPGETVIVNPPDSLISGQKVRVVATPAAIKDNA